MTDQPTYETVAEKYDGDLSKLSADEQRILVEGRSQERIASQAAARGEALIRDAQRELTELADSTSPVYTGIYKNLLPSQRQARIDEIHARLAREGLSLPAAPTPEQRAVAQLDRQYGQEFNPTLAHEIEQRTAAFEAKGESAIVASIDAVKIELGEAEYQRAVANGRNFGNADRRAVARQLGSAAYDALAADAKKAFPAGFELPKGALADLYSLKQLANYGRYVERGAAAYAKVRGSK